MKAPEDCRTMKELRAAIDAVDTELVAMLVRRAGYIDRAIELKPQEAIPARVPDRVAEVLANVRSKADAQGLDPDLVQALWRQLIEWSIAREEKVLGPADPKRG